MQHNMDKTHRMSHSQMIKNGITDRAEEPGDVFAGEKYAVKYGGGLVRYFLYKQHTLHLWLDVPKTLRC